MPAPASWWRLVLATALLGLLVAPPALGEEEPAAEDAAEGEAEPLSSEEAKRLSKLLGKAAKRRKAEDVLPVLDEVGDRSHESFRKPLLKMLTHDLVEVALRAADMLRGQTTETEKEAAKLGKSIWKSGWAHRANHKRYVVQGRALLAVATHEKEPLDANRYREVEKLWRKIIGAPNAAFAPALVAICEYVRLTKDKRLCRLLAEEIDEKVATDVNSPSNPPASWWEQRWKLWRAVMSEAVETLELLTGQSFKSTAEAKAWFRENEREFGFEW